MPNRDVIVVAASAGGVEAIRDVLGGLPEDLPAAVLIVLHMPPSGGSTLATILARSTSLPVASAVDGERLVPGRVYVCLGDHHLLVGRGHVHVRRGPRENGHRPAADPLFRSAATRYGPRAIGVVLSGTLSDGTAGLGAIRRMGGVAVVQHPDDALYAAMPKSALEYVGADHVVPATEIGPLLGRLAQEEVRDIWPEADGAGGVGGRAAGSVSDDVNPPDQLRREVELMESDDRVVENDHPGRPSSWPCPDCHGVLWEIHDGSILRFRCRVGHAWTAESLLHEQGESVEAALWMALRALEDRAALSKTLAERAEQSGRRYSAGRFREEQREMGTSIDVLRRMVQRWRVSDEVPPEEDPAAAGASDA